MARKINMEHQHMLYLANDYVVAWFMWQLQGDNYVANVLEKLLK